MSSAGAACDWDRKQKFGVSTYMFWAAFVIEIVACAVWRKRWLRRSQDARFVLVSIVSVTVSTLLRAIWFTLRGCGFDTATENLINRFSCLFLFAAFSSYLASWVIFLRHTTDNGGNIRRIRSDSEESVSVFRALLAVNAFASLFLLAMSVAFYGFDCESCYNVGIICISMISCLLSAGFTSYGIAMKRTLSGYADSMDVLRCNARKTIDAAVRKVIFVGLISTACFLTRAVFFMWKPASGKYAPEIAYPWFFYTVVELVPTACLFVVLAPKQDATSRRGASGKSSRKADTCMRAEILRSSGIASDAKLDPGRGSTAPYTQYADSSGNDNSVTRVRLKEVAREGEIGDRTDGKVAE